MKKTRIDLGLRVKHMANVIYVIFADWLLLVNGAPPIE